MDGIEKQGRVKGREKQGREREAKIHRRKKGKYTEIEDSHRTEQGVFVCQGVGVSECVGEKMRFMYDLNILQGIIIIPMGVLQL